MSDLVSVFERYAGWADDVTPLYGTLSRAAAADRRLLDVAAESPAGQPAPQLLLAAVHSLLLRGADHRLARFYPSCGGDAAVGNPSGVAVEGPDDGSDRDEALNPDPATAFREFCLANEDRLRGLVSTRRVQTNDVGRSAVLLPAFEHACRVAGTRRLATVELGASAGLNCNWDRYRYAFEGAGSAGPADSPVEIGTEVRGDIAPPLPDEPPAVVHRTGVDVNPLDATDPDDAHWLHALVHPDQPRRHERLDAALAVAGDHPPDLVEADALAALPDLLAAAPRDAALVVFSTHVLYQLDDEAVAKLRELLAAHGSERPVHWLSIDPDGDLGTPTYRHVRFDGAEGEATHLAQFESYGEWVRWLAE